MTNKLQKRAQKSKLQTNLPEEKSTFLNQKINSTIRSFRLDNQTWQDLQEILNKLNNQNPRKKISASLLIKTLIYLGKKSTEKQLIKILREIII